MAIALPVQAFVRSLPPFTDWPPEAIESIAVPARIERYLPGEHVYRAGDPPKGLWIVFEGWFQVVRNWSDGQRAVLDHQQPGQMTGLLPLFDGFPAPFDVVARIAASMIFIPAAPFLGVLERTPSLMFGIASLLCRRSRLDYARHVAQSLNSPRAIIAKTLLSMCRGGLASPKGAIEVPVRIPQEDIAALWGLTRQTVNRELRRMIKEGVIAMHYRGLAVNNVAKLIEIASEEEPFDAFETALLFPKGRPVGTSM